jgi:hypothetical protein
MSTPGSTSSASRTVLWLMGGILVATWALLLYLLRSGTTAPPATAGHVTLCEPGPWGELSYSRIVIEPPESVVFVAQPKARAPVWHFPGYSPDQLAALWATVPLRENERAHFNDRSLWEHSPQGIRMQPHSDIVLALSPEARTQIYSVLAEFEENPEQNDPFRFRADVASEWFAHSGLKPETVELVKRLLYRRGTSLLFSDLGLILPQVPTLHERTRLIKTLARKSTLMVKLRIRADSDIAALDRYWGRGQRAKDIKPLLQSLVREGNGTTIDIIHLLPRQPRSLLYTYPTPDEPGSRTYMDCHWSTLNFFNSVSDPRYMDIAEVNRAFSEDHHPITTDPTFGDVVMFTKTDGTVIHSCIYIAADIVYTKNGASPNAPWILMMLSDVVAFYPTTEPLDIQYYRAKAIPVD